MTQNPLFQKQKKVAQLNHGEMNLQVQSAPGPLTPIAHLPELLIEQLDPPTQFQRKPHQLPIAESRQLSRADGGINNATLSSTTRSWLSTAQ